MSAIDLKLLEHTRALQKAYSLEHREPVRQRLRAVKDVLLGKSAEEVARAEGVELWRVKQWFRVLRVKGIAGLGYSASITPRKRKRMHSSDTRQNKTPASRNKQLT